MKLAVLIAEPPRADARPPGRDGASAKPGAAFDDVLAEMNGEAVTSKPAAIVTLPHQIATASPTVATKDEAAKIYLEAAASSEPGVAGGAVALASLAGPLDEDAAGALLKRFKTKDEATAADATTDGSAAKIDPAVAAPLLTSLQAVTPAPTTSTPEARSTPALAEAKLEAPSAPPAAQKSAPAANLILDVSLASHVAPTSAAPARAAGEEAAAAASPDIADRQEPGAAPSDSKTAATPAIAVQPPHASRPAARDVAAPVATEPTAEIAPPNAGRTASGDAGTSSGEHAPRDRSVEPVAARPTEDASSSQLPAAVAAQAPVGRIVAAVAALAGPVTHAAAVPGAVATTQIAPARTMTLQMSPADLGTVEVRLHLSGDALDLQLTISERETLGLVTRERDALSSALQGQSYDIHSLVIQDGNNIAPSGGTHVAKQDTPGERAADHSGRNSSGGRASQQQERPARDPRPRDDDRRSRVADGRSLFI